MASKEMARKRRMVPKNIDRTENRGIRPWNLRTGIMNKKNISTPPESAEMMNPVKPRRTRRDPENFKAEDLFILSCIDEVRLISFEGKLYVQFPFTGPMVYSTITLIGPDDWAGSIGKETSNTSFRIGALKKDDSVVTVLHPSKYPDKLWSLLFTFSLTDRVLLNVRNIDRDLGETIIALDLSGIKKGGIHLGDTVDRQRFSALARGTVLENWDEFDPDPAFLREDLFSNRNQWPEGPPMVVVDQAFPVKGVGTVVLAFVVSGKISRHQELFTFPGGKRTHIRSIQIHDKDHEEAPAGARVGLAMKNIDPEDLPRGCVLSVKEGGVQTRDQIEAELRVSPYWREPISEGQRLHMWSSLQFLPVIVDKVLEENHEDGVKTFKLGLTPESPIWTGPSSRVGLAYLDSRTFRLFASGEII